MASTEKHEGVPQRLDSESDPGGSLGLQHDGAGVGCGRFDNDLLDWVPQERSEGSGRFSADRCDGGVHVRSSMSRECFTSWPSSHGCMQRSLFLFLSERCSERTELGICGGRCAPRRAWIGRAYFSSGQTGKFDDSGGRELGDSVESSGCQKKLQLPKPCRSLLLPGFEQKAREPPRAKQRLQNHPMHLWQIFRTWIPEWSEQLSSQGCQLRHCNR